MNKEFEKEHVLLMSLSTYFHAFISDFFQVCPNCLKAYIHMARAHCALKHYDKAREWYRKAWECDPKKENMIKGMLYSKILDLLPLL